MSVDALDIQIGQRIAAARKKAGLTLRALAAQLAWPYTTLGNYEAGRRPLKVAQLIQIALVLQVSPAALLADTPETAAIINRIHGDLERSLQVAFILDSLDGTP